MRCWRLDMRLRAATWLNAWRVLLLGMCCVLLGVSMCVHCMLCLVILVTDDVMEM